MKKKPFYLHVSYMKSIDGSTYTNDALVCMEREKNMSWLRNELKKKTEKELGITLKKAPIIMSLTEISEELYDTLLSFKE